MARKKSENPFEDEMPEEIPAEATALESVEAIGMDSDVAMMGPLGAGEPSEPQLVRAMNITGMTLMIDGLTPFARNSTQAVPEAQAKKWAAKGWIRILD